MRLPKQSKPVMRNTVTVTSVSETAGIGPSYDCYSDRKCNGKKLKGSFANCRSCKNAGGGSLDGRGGCQKCW